MARCMRGFFGSLEPISDAGEVKKVALPGMRFLMMLALRMGRTLSELRREMSASEIMMWAELTGSARWGRTG